jgi:hypothetical protein
VLSVIVFALVAARVRWRPETSLVAPAEPQNPPPAKEARR